MERKLHELKLSELLEKFGAGNATPGSGSASALQGMLAAQLLRTVIALTKDPRRSISYSKHLSRLLEIENEIESRILPRLEQLFQEDSDQFDIVIRLRKERDGAVNLSVKRQKDSEILAAMVVATEFPIQIAKNCNELGTLALEVFDFGFRSAQGDSGVAINAAISGIAGSLSIIELNLISFDENGWTKQIREASDALRNDLDSLQQHARQRLSDQKSRSERYARFSVERQKIERWAKGKKKFFAESEILELVTRLQRFLWIYRDLIWKKNPPSNPLEVLDPEVALKILGFQVSHHATLGSFRIRGRAYEIAGQINQRERTVFISDQFPKLVRRFTSAHELGHSLLHIQEVLHRDRSLDGSDERSSSAPEEWQADKFASYFLMPEKLVRKMFRKVFQTDRFKISRETAFALNENGSENLSAKCRDLRGLSRLLAATTFYNSRAVKSMSEIFNVSPEAMAIRLEELDLVEF